MLELAPIAVPFSIVGLLITRARPDNVIGWIFLATGSLWALDIVRDTYARSVLLFGSPDVLGTAVVFEWIGRWSWVPLITPALLFAPMFFPDGRLPSPRWWPLFFAAVAGAVVLCAEMALRPGEDPEGLPGISNPYGSDSPWLAALFGLGSGALLLVIIATMVSLGVRLGRATRSSGSSSRCSSSVLWCGQL